MNKIMKWAIGGVAIIVVILISYSISNSNKPTETGTIKIGILAPLTGQVSVLGERMRNGMELAKGDLINEGVIGVGGIEIIYEDACFSKESLSAARKLIYVDKVKIIGGSFCLFGTDSVVPITESNKIILFNTAANPESVLNKKYVFSTNFAIRDDAAKMAEYAYNKLGARTASMIYLNTSFGKSYRNNFKISFERLGGLVLNTEAKLPNATDFRTALTKIKSNNPDILLIIHFGSSLGDAIKQARELGIKSVLMGDYESEDPTVLKFAGSASEGLIISSSQPAVKTEEVKAFEQKYLDKYGELPDVLARNGYDAIRLQVSTYLKCGGDTDCMVKELHKVKNYKGVSGSITINKDNSTKKNTIFKIVKDGKFIELK